MLQYAGVNLLMPDSGGWLADFLARTDLDRLDLFGACPVALCDQRNQAVGNHRPITPFPLPNYRTAPPLELNQLHWPSGATRWSTFVGLTTSTGLDAIRNQLPSESALGVDAYRMTPLPFIMADSEFQGTIDARSLIDSDGRAAVYTMLTMLEPRALSTVKGTETLWLLPLVDVRYFWQDIQMPHRVPSSLLSSRVTEQDLKTSWSGWLALLQHAIDSQTTPTTTLAFNPDPVSSEYFFPDMAEFDQPQHNAAVVLDALAHSCGRRFVRQYSGACELIDCGKSRTRHNQQLIDNTGGGIAVLPHSDAKDVDSRSTGQALYARMAIYPQFVDVTYRQLVEYDADDVPADEPQGTIPAPFNAATAVLAGTGTRTVRTDTRASNAGARNIVENTSKVIHTPSWVGRHLWHDGNGSDCPEPPGIIDDAFYGDRYFRLANQITTDYVEWKAQQHEYDLSGFQPYELSGFDDAVTWDHQRGSTHVRSHSTDFGVSTQLVQVHRQCSFDREQIVGFITSEWTLYPKVLERPRDPNLEQDDDCLLLTASQSIGNHCYFGVTIDSITSDQFDFTWQWAEAEVKPFIPTDPWAATNSIQYGRAMVWAGSSVIGVTRSQKIIQALRDTLDCDTLPGANAPANCPSVLSASTPDDCYDWNRSGVLASASGVSYLRRYGCEWQFLQIDCD
jgi:hypothetical protein